MLTAGTSSTAEFACASATQRTLRHLRTKRKGQPVFVLGHVPQRKGQEATFQLFNERLAVVKFADDETHCEDHGGVLLHTEIDVYGVACFEIRQCASCDQHFPLTSEEAQAEEEPTTCSECSS